MKEDIKRASGDLIKRKKKKPKMRGLTSHNGLRTVISRLMSPSLLLSVRWRFAVRLSLPRPAHKPRVRARDRTVRVCLKCTRDLSGDLNGVHFRGFAMD